MMARVGARLGGHSSSQIMRSIRLFNNPIRSLNYVPLRPIPVASLKAQVASAPNAFAGPCWRLAPPLSPSLQHKHKNLDMNLMLRRYYDANPAAAKEKVEGKTIPPSDVMFDPLPSPQDSNIFPYSNLIIMSFLNIHNWNWSTLRTCSPRFLGLPHFSFPARPTKGSTSSPYSTTHSSGASLPLLASSPRSKSTHHSTHSSLGSPPF